ncbi:cobalamin biosynthesis protein [Dactylosporangium aurantiacum]|uniref:Cobalamin biosynthesis protein CobD n=1 Tax=Dactylosporangium aurantiacum TaxID=35754 RepID=A0A9Q9IKD8_9ACTN|nr:cobalamin biosynthesis protein [Dactylosporangium aurantiacum]MDG6104752.1 cobalamin biosynthesis protein [Dactylosporangium aurantiacum]UWZ55685.1 cobalamin biosynthesis protein [Dactylosporangium aurantiacum]
MVLRRLQADAIGMLLGGVLDAMFGDPRRWHPVAGFGRFAGAVERHTYADARPAGARFTAVAVGVPVTLAALAAWLTRRRPVARTVLVAGATWAALGGTSLAREGRVMADRLDGGDLDSARAQLPNLCGRDPSALGAPELARATVESVAENTSDAVVGPLFWGAVAGLPGIVGYRAVNTLDAMVGHRSARYARFGTASARLDDLANLVPSRVTAALTVAAAPVVGGRSGAALRVWLRDGGRHPSPNSGQCEAAAAGALGVRLGGRNVYGSRVEERPHLGDGGPPGPRDVRRAAVLSLVVGAAALGLACAARAGATRAGAARAGAARAGAATAEAAGREL